MSGPVAEVLLEIGCEEIPAGMIVNAMRELQAILHKHLEAENLLEGSEIQVFGAPGVLRRSAQA